jgi:hypothetical protein
MMHDEEEIEDAEILGEDEDFAEEGDTDDEEKEA